MNTGIVAGRASGVSLGMALLLAASTLASFSATNIALARFTDTRSVTGNAFTTGTWGVRRYYLHNFPTPPTADTTSQYYPSMDAAVPSSGTLYNYDTDCSKNKAGRDFQRTTQGIYETRVCYVANWVAPTQSGDLTVNGQATLIVWSATRNFASGSAGNLTAALLDYDVGGGTATLMASTALTQANWQGGSGTWVQKTLTFPSISYTVATGHRLEVRIVATTAADRTMWVAYDTSSYRSYLQLP